MTDEIALFKWFRKFCESHGGWARYLPCGKIDYFIPAKDTEDAKRIDEEFAVALKSFKKGEPHD